MCICSKTSHKKKSPYFYFKSEERGTPSRRSKSEGPYRIPNGDVYPVGDVVDKPNGHPKTGSKVWYQWHQLNYILTKTFLYTWNGNY